MLLNKLSTVIARGGRSIVPRRSFSTSEVTKEGESFKKELCLSFAKSAVWGYVAFVGGRRWRPELEEDSRQQIKQEYERKHFVGADAHASSPV